MRESLVQVAGDDALNPLIDLRDRVCARMLTTLRPTGKEKRPGSGPRQRLADDMGNLARLVDISSQHKHVTAWHAPGNRPDRLGFRKPRSVLMMSAPCAGASICRRTGRLSRLPVIR